MGGIFVDYPRDTDSGSDGVNIFGSPNYLIIGYHFGDGNRLPNVTAGGCWFDGSYDGINVSRSAIESIEVTTGSRLS